MPSYDDLTPLQQELYCSFFNDHDGQLDFGFDTQFSDADFCSVFKVLPSLAHIHDLRFNFTLLGDQLVEHLAKCDSFPSLVQLRLNGTKIGDKGIKYLAESHYFYLLEWLVLNFTQVGNLGLKYLIDNKCFPRLTCLVLYDPG